MCEMCEKLEKVRKVVKSSCFQVISDARTFGKSGFKLFKGRVHKNREKWENTKSCELREFLEFVENKILYCLQYNNFQSHVLAFYGLGLSMLSRLIYGTYGNFIPKRECIHSRFVRISFRCLVELFGVELKLIVAKCAKWIHKY